MKPFQLLLLLAPLLTGCVKKIDDTDKPCSSGCTVIQGKIVTKNNAPVSNARITVSYQKANSGFSSYTRRIRSATTDANGNYELRFYINDDELGIASKGYFSLDINRNSFDPNQYLIDSDVMPTFNTTIYSISKRDTVISQDFYLPAKTMIKVHLKGFQPLAAGDRFLVTALFPYGWSMDSPNTFLGGRFSTGSFGLAGEYGATSGDYTAMIPVAANDTCVIRIGKIKNGISTPQDVGTFIPESGVREYTFTY